MICDIVTPDGKPYEGDPRYVLRRALERMEAMGFDTFNVGPELEYFLFKDNLGTETLDEGGYFAMTTLDAATELRQQTYGRSRAWASRSSTSTTRSGRRSTRSTCVSRRR
jgi:glutamine synthetase